MLMRTIREPMRILSISMACLATLPVLGQTDSSGSALSFNGANSYVSIPTTGSLTGTFTVEMWFYPGSTNLLALFGSRFLPQEFGFDLQIRNANEIHGDIGNGTSWITINADAYFPYSTGTWHHVAFVVTPTVYSIYGDGNLVGLGAVAENDAVLYDANHNLGVGWNGFPNSMVGQIDEVRIWSTARNASEIQTNMHRTLTGSETGLMGYWRFDEGTGTTTIDASGHGFTGTLTNGPTWVASTAPIGPPTPFVLADIITLVAETCTNNAIDPGERVKVSFGLRNLGTANTTNLVATLQAGGGVSSPSGPQSYGVLVTNGAAVVRSFTFTGSGFCGSNNTATLLLRDGATSLGTATFTFPLGQTVVTTNLFENFDGVTPPDLPVDWVTSASGAEVPWVTTTATFDTLPNSAFVPDVPDVGLSELDSPTITLPASPSQLSFRHYYNLEWGGSVGYDGGVLEININGGGWSDILDAGGSFVSGGYIAPISAFYNNPLSGRSAWTGSSSGFINTVVNLPSAAAGQPIQLRWLCGTDNSVSYTGWYVDTVAVTVSTLVCCSPPPVFTDATRNGSALSLSWSALPGRSYQLFYTTNLIQPNWTALTTITANDFTATGTDSISPGRPRFYRVALLP